MAKVIKNADRISSYSWRGQELILLRLQDADNSPYHYHVLGYKKGEPVDGIYATEPVLKKDQRGCRAYIRGEMSQVGRIPDASHARISFLER